MRRSNAGSVAFVVAIVAVGVASMNGCTSLRTGATALLGEARVQGTMLAQGNLEVPDTRRAAGYLPGEAPVVADSDVVRAIVEEWAGRELPDWQEEGKVTAPRVILAKLALGIDIQEVNDYILAARPWAGIGSTWGLRPNGDYDFSLPPLTAILYLFGSNEEVLYPRTREHLLTVLLNQEGDEFTRTVPGSLHLVQETENHILMIEGSRYLKNQWLVEHGRGRPEHDNAANLLEDRLVSFIRELEAAGPYEFNSNPYAGYTLMALLTLEAFAHEPVAAAARSLIDRINYEFVLGSLDARRFAVFRRQTRRAGITDLSDHPHVSMMRIWANCDSQMEYPVESNAHQAVYAALLPYRLPERQLELLMSTDRDYYVQIGRGPGASPEIYSAGEGYLISSGGTGRGGRSQMVARPVTVMLTDGALDAVELFSLGGEGDHTRWNNTGVLPGVAVGRAPAVIPESYSPRWNDGVWSVYEVPGDLLICVADTGRTAVIGVLDLESLRTLEIAPADVAFHLSARNSGATLDSGVLALLDGREIRYDLDADMDSWVIEGLSGGSLFPRDIPGRDVTAWPRLGGWMRD